MCVVALALDTHPKWRIILAGNRDEFHARPSAPLARWDGEDSHIIAGRDLVSGGTWLGVSETGRIAVVTNIRTGASPDPALASRGDLVADYLRGDGLPPAQSLNGFNAFSLITIGPEGATLSANRPSTSFAPITPGIHGLSNGVPNEVWPRKERLMASFSDIIDSADNLPDALLDLLTTVAIDDSIFIRNEVYGTRCSTVLLVDYSGTGMMIEHQFGCNGEPVNSTEASLSFTPEPSPTAQ